MVTSHAAQRMKERGLTKNVLVVAMKRGKWNADYKGRLNIRLVQYKDINVVVDIYTKDILTCWRG